MGILDHLHLRKKKPVGSTWCNFFTSTICSRRYERKALWDMTDQENGGKQKRKKKKIVAENGFDPSTSGLWAQHASTAPLCLLIRIKVILIFQWNTVASFFFFFLLAVDAQVQLNAAVEKERKTLDKELMQQLRINSLETQQSELRQERAQLLASLEFEKAKSETLEEAQRR